MTDNAKTSQKCGRTICAYEISIRQARQVAQLFDIPEPIEIRHFLHKGNINRHSFLVISGPGGQQHQYLLQLLNPEVFTDPQSVMHVMHSCIQAQRKALSQGLLHKDEEWEPIELIPTKEGKNWLELWDHEARLCWRMMKKIGHARSYKSLGEIPDRSERLRVAEEAGRGLALFGILTASLDASSIPCPLPGYRQTGVYYDQLLSVLAGSRDLRDAAPFLPKDPLVNLSTRKYFLVNIQPKEYQSRLSDPQLQPLIDLALKQRPFALTLQEELRRGKLRKVVVHGDTKLDNFLFSTRTGKVKALVDLDTVMAHTWLSDWGDLARSLVNTASETEPDPDKVEVDLQVFNALAKGFLQTRRGLKKDEISLMVEAAQIMALELGVRFLTDYLRGDTYFRLSPEEPPELNKIRAVVQFTIFKKLQAHSDEARRYIQQACAQ